MPPPGPLPLSNIKVTGVRQSETLDKNKVGQQEKCGPAGKNNALLPLGTRENVPNKDSPATKRLDKRKAVGVFSPFSHTCCNTSIAIVRTVARAANVPRGDIALVVCRLHIISYIKFRLGSIEYGSPSLSLSAGGAGVACLVNNS